MKRIKLFFVLFIISFLFINGIMTAEEKKEEKKDYDVYTLGEIVVSGQKSAVRDIGIINEVTFEDIKATDSKTVAQALNYVPGIQVTTERKNEAGVSLQGFDQTKVVVLIDGVPYYETKYGKLDLNQLGTNGIARIDVIKGAASVLYGANAEAGVINIITKKPTEDPSFDANIEIGSKEGRTLSLSHGMKKGIMNYWLGYTHREFDAWPLSDDFVPRTGVITRKPGGTTNAIIENGGHYRDNSDYNTNNLWGKIGIEPNDKAEYYVNMQYIQTEKGDPPNVDTITIFPNRPAFSWFDRMVNYEDWGIDFNAKQILSDKLTLKGTFFYHNHKDEYVSYSDATYRTSIADSEYKDYVLGEMILAEYRPVDWDTLRMSFHYRGDSHKQRDDVYLPFEDNFAYTGSIGLENETSFMDKKIALVLGISYDWFMIDKATANTTNSRTGAFIAQVDKVLPDTKNESNPMIGINYYMNDTTRFFASAARKTRFPTLNELFSSKGGNAELDSETSINYTIGVNKSFGSNFAFEIAPFYHDISDRISRDLPDPDPANLFHNTAKISMLGVETNIMWNPTADLAFNLGYTYIDAEDDSPGQVVDVVTNVPKHKMNIRMNYIVPVIDCRMDLNMTYFGKSYDQLPTALRPTQAVIVNDRYTIFNAKLSREIMEDFNGYFRVENMFDKNYETSVGYPAPGRSVWVGLSYKY
jgi:iron complex outermembrane recepter protein